MNWPIPTINGRTMTTEFVPVIGRQTRRFRSMWDAQQYDLGYSRATNDMPIAPDACAAMEQGFDDGRRDVAERKVVTFAEFLKARAKARGVKTFDQLLAEVSQ